MFVQLVIGTLTDAAGLQRQLDRWSDEVASGVSGWLGGTGGSTADGQGVLLSRWISEGAAAVDSKRRASRRLRARSGQ